METDSEWLTTGRAAEWLGVSRQHVVDLCDRGELRHVRTGSHRRLRASDVRALMTVELTREQEKSLWLHRSLLGPLMSRPKEVMEQARQNIAHWLPKHRDDGMTVRYLRQWERILDEGVHSVVAVLTSLDEASHELRQNSPFAGVLSEPERREVLRAFRDHWAEEHAAA